MATEKVEFINLPRQSNESHYEFGHKTSIKAQEYPAVALLWADILPKYNAALDVEFSLLDFQRKSQFTKPMKETDIRRDNNVGSIRSIAKAFLTSSDPAKAEAARLIIERLDEFKGISSKAFEKETAAIQVLVNDMRVKFKNETPLLGLTDLVNELETNNNAFEALFDQRNTELANREGEKMIDSRGVSDGHYYNMIDVLNGDITVNGDVNYHSFVLSMNEQIKYYKEHAHHPEHHDINNAVAAPIPTQTYTGKAITPIPEVHYVEEGKPTVELVFAVDFMLTYKENVNAGDAEIIIHGKGKYKGKKIITFNIARTI